MERDSHHALSQANLTQHTPQRPSANSDLDVVLEQAKDQLQLQMLLIEVASCDDSADFSLIARAYDFARQRHEGQHRKSGHPFLQHCVEVARLLAQLRMDDTTVAAGLLHDVIEDTHYSKEDLAEAFGDTVAELVEGVSKLDKLAFSTKQEAQAENFRKMMMAMVQDIRVILIKLADRTHNMRTLGSLRPDKRRRIALETLEIYAPIAHRLGIHDIKNELEDLGFQAMYPMRHRALKSAVKQARGNRKEIIENIRQELGTRLEGYNIEATVVGREKHLYSIYRKMKKVNQMGQ